MKKNIDKFSEAERDTMLLDISLKLLPLYGPQWNVDGLVTLKRQSLSRILYLNHLYQMIIDVPGVICEFGVKWGTTLSHLTNLMGIYEPYNHSRKIFGFDTFEGHSEVVSQDGALPRIGFEALSTSALLCVGCMGGVTNE
jgi:hypothetical protein